MKKLMALFLTIVCVLALVGCSQTQQESTAATFADNSEVIPATETAPQTEPTSVPVLDCKSMQEAIAWSFGEPDTVTVLGGEWAYTAEPNGYVALVKVNYAAKFNEYETAEFVVAGVFGEPASTNHCLNQHSPYTRENVLEAFGAINDQRFALE